MRLILGSSAMQDHCSVFRNAAVLDDGLREMAAVSDSLCDFAVADRALIWNTDHVEALELDNLVGRRRSCGIRRCTAPRAAARTRARTSPSATSATGSSTPSAGGTATARCVSATGRCTFTRAKLIGNRPNVDDVRAGCRDPLGMASHPKSGR
jgi:hypothetical protein